MTFRRSASALHSLHIFFRVDVVVYCEGGPSLTYADATVPMNSNSTLDTFYWNSVVNSYGLQKTFHFKSIGGKETIAAIAQEINTLGIESISVCRDIDYDRVLGRPLITGRAAHTRGYSWENDVMQLPVLECLISNLVGAGAEGASLVQDLRDKFARLEADLQRWTEIDVSLLVRGRGCLFDRDKPLASIDMAAPPNLQISSLSQRLQTAGYQRRPKRVVAIAKTEVISVCYGKLISKALYHTFVRLIRQVSPMRIDYELFMRLAISETFKAMMAGLLPSFAVHVQEQRKVFM